MDQLVKNLHAMWGTWVGRSPGEGKDYPLQCSGLENSMDCIVHGVAESWTRLKRLSSSSSTEDQGEGNGNPFQSSCMGSPVDGSLVGYRPWGRTELDTPEATKHAHTEDQRS